MVNLEEIEQWLPERHILTVVEISITDLRGLLDEARNSRALLEKYREVVDDLGGSYVEVENSHYLKTKAKSVPNG